jgi:hypothetical protein
MTNKEYFQNWAETHTLRTISFWWGFQNGQGECRLHDKTYNEAVKIAKVFGYKEPKWFNPWTWANGVVTVG